MFKSFLDQYPEADSRKPKLPPTMAIEHFEEKVTGCLLCYWVLEEKTSLSQKKETSKCYYTGKTQLH